MTQFILSLCLVLFLPFTAIAQEINEDDIDLYNGRDVNVVCAACHGELGQGGNKGEYPRLAGQMRSILIRQLHSFRDRTRINIPMLPYTDERELPQEDMIDVTTYLSSLRIDVTIPYVEGDVKAGKKLFKDCRKCHGKEGRGKEKVAKSGKHGPALTGQYPSYIIRQMANFKKGIRHHEDMEETARDLADDELNDILAYLVTLERHPGLAEEVAKQTEERFGKVLNSLSETIKASGSGVK
jgi:cytochrome c553